MRLSPAEEFRPHLLWFFVSMAVSMVLGAIGVGFLMYYGPLVLAVILGSILLSRNAKKRVVSWGMLCGLVIGFFAAWSYLLATR